RARVAPAATPVVRAATSPTVRGPAARAAITPTVQDPAGKAATSPMVRGRAARAATMDAAAGRDQAEAPRAAAAVAVPAVGGREAAPAPADRRTTEPVLPAIPEKVRDLPRRARILRARVQATQRSTERRAQRAPHDPLSQLARPSPL